MHDARVHANQHLRVGQHAGDLSNASSSNHDLGRSALREDRITQCLAAYLVRRRASYQECSSGCQEPQSQFGPARIRPLPQPTARSRCPCMEYDYLFAAQYNLRKRTSGDHQSRSKMNCCSKGVCKATQVFQLVTVTVMNDCSVVSTVAMLPRSLEPYRKARARQERVQRSDSLPRSEVQHQIQGASTDGFDSRVGVGNWKHFDGVDCG